MLIMTKHMNVILHQNSSCQKLISSLKKILIHGLVSAQKALEYQRVKTYWEMGKNIDEAIDSSNGELVGGEKLYEEISDQLRSDLDMDISADTIFRAVQFSRNYEIFPENTPLTFTHYLLLHRVKDKHKRLGLEKKAIRNKWTVPQLKKEITILKISVDAPFDKKNKILELKRGELFVYYAHPQIDIFKKQGMFIDCGFKINIPIEGEILKGNISTETKQKRVVKVEKEKGKYAVRLHKKYSEKLYTYRAIVEKIVDGDTLDVRIDVGFGIYLNERIRLKSIDAPEIKTQEGKRAKVFLEKYLSQCPLIVIRTHKAGMYGRWLADVFALPKCAEAQKIADEGEFLNQRLLDEGLAQEYA